MKKPPTEARSRQLPEWLFVAGREVHPARHSIFSTRQVHSLKLASFASHCSIAELIWSSPRVHHEPYVFFFPFPLPLVVKTAGAAIILLASPAWLGCPAFP